MLAWRRQGRGMLGLYKTLIKLYTHAPSHCYTISYIICFKNQTSNKYKRHTNHLAKDRVSVSHNIRRRFSQIYTLFALRNGVAGHKLTGNTSTSAWVSFKELVNNKERQRWSTHEHGLEDIVRRRCCRTAQLPAVENKGQQKQAKRG